MTIDLTVYSICSPPLLANLYIYAWMACSLCGGVMVGLVCPVDQPFSVLLAYCYSMAVQVDVNIKAFMYSTI